MAVETSLIEMRYSVKTGSAGDSTQGTATGSLGKYISTTLIPSGGLHNLFDLITGSENQASDVEYRCFFVANLNATTWGSVKVWIDAEVPGGATTEIGLDTTAVSALTSASAQALEVVDESTAPSGVSFSAPTTEATGLVVGDLAQDECKAIWVKRSAQNTGSVANDGATLRFSGSA